MKHFTYDPTDACGDDCKDRAKFPEPTSGLEFAWCGEHGQWWRSTALEDVTGGAPQGGTVTWVWTMTESVPATVRARVNE